MRNERESWPCVRRRWSGNSGGAWVGDPRCQAGVAIQWLWSLSTDESQVTAAPFSGFARFQSVTRRL
jgi:hypothetical protein